MNFFLDFLNKHYNMQNQAENKMRTITLVPKPVIDTLCPCVPPSYISKLIDDEKIPYMRIIELENFFIMRMDRCCPCDCNDRYQVKKIKKEEIDEFINTQLKGCVKVCDYYFTPTDSV